MLHAPSVPRPPGRPRALDEAKRREICALISAGCGMEGAARYVGCATSTIRREASRNSDFNEKLRRANLSAELGPLNAMRQAANSHWRAAAWLLERADVQRYGRQNARQLKPEQLADFTEALVEILNSETKDEETRLRIVRRLDQLIEQTDREVRAQYQPMAKPRRGKSKSYRPKQLPAIHAEPLPEDYVPAPLPGPMP